MPAPRFRHARMTQLHPSADIETIKALLAAGLSQAQIGVKLSMTRDAVGGLVRRMKHGGAAARALPRPKPVIIRPPKPVAAAVEPVPANAVPLIELGDHGCHWPVRGEGLATLFCNDDRGGHVSYCRRHHARSIRIDEPKPFVRPKTKPLMVSPVFVLSA